MPLSKQIAKLELPAPALFGKILAACETQSSFSESERRDAQAFLAWAQAAAHQAQEARIVQSRLATMLFGPLSEPIPDELVTREPETEKDPPARPKKRALDGGLPTQTITTEPPEERIGARCGGCQSGNLRPTYETSRTIVMASATLRTVEHKTVSLRCSCCGVIEETPEHPELGETIAATTIPRSQPLLSSATARVCRCCVLRPSRASWGSR